MRLFPQVVLTTAYFPPVEYFFAIASSRRVLLEQCEYYQKQSYRSRCRIYSAAGPETLSVPVVKETTLSRPIRDMKVDYTDPWLQVHKRAFDAAYNSSAFYEYYKDDIFSVLDSRPKYLFDLNASLLELLLGMVGLKTEISLTEDFVKDYGEGDLRERIHPKFRGESLLAQYKKEKTYFQVFSDRQGFVPNLSILDLLCNEGPNAISFLL